MPELRRIFPRARLRAAFLPGRILFVASCLLVAPSCDQPGGAHSSIGAQWTENEIPVTATQALETTKAVPNVHQKQAPKEIKIMVSGTLRHPVYAFGGETTGTVIKTAKGEIFELDLGKPDDWKERLKALNGKSIDITGKLMKRKGLEVPDRNIIKVTDLKAAKN